MYNLIILYVRPDENPVSCNILSLLVIKFGGFSSLNFNISMTNTVFILVYIHILYICMHALVYSIMYTYVYACHRLFNIFRSYRREMYNGNSFNPKYPFNTKWKIYSFLENFSTSKFNDILFWNSISDCIPMSDLFSHFVSHFVSIIYIYIYIQYRQIFERTIGNLYLISYWVLMK